jgi:hypothetical protein
MRAFAHCATPGLSGDANGQIDIGLLRSDISLCDALATRDREGIAGWIEACYGAVNTGTLTPMNAFAG